MEKVDPYFNKDETNIFKGIAIIFMFILHFFTIPDFYINGIEYTYLENIAPYLNKIFGICVGIFAFITGYCYYFVKNKNYKYSLKKITDLWIVYLFVFIILLIITFSLGCFYDKNILEIILEEIFGLKGYIMYFCWYVVFYFLSMLILPIYNLIANKNIFFACFFGVIFPIVFVDLLNIIIGQSDFIVLVLLKQILNNLVWFPIIASGYIFSRYNIFSLIFDKIFNNKLKIFFYCLLFFVPLVARCFLQSINIVLTLSLDFIFTPLLIYGIVNICRLTKYSFPIIRLLGKNSLIMWFFHCVFFNCCKEYTQKLLYFPKNPLLVLLWGLGICLLVSLGVNYITSKIIKFKNKLLKL